MFGSWKWKIIFMPPGWATLDRGTCPILFEWLCFQMVEDGEARRRENPWLHMGIFQGMHSVKIHPKEFSVHLKMQTP
jgi:hypothetical protein